MNNLLKQTWYGVLHVVAGLDRFYADPNLGEVAATVWEKKFGKKPTDNIFTANALFYFLGEEGFKEEADGGRLIEFGLEFAENSTFKSYGELDTLDTTRISVFDCARFDWKIHAGTVVYSELERLRAQASAGKYDLIAEKLENGKNSHIANMNRAMWSDGTGNGSQDIGGLQLIISTTPTTGSVGQINRATFSFWRNQQTSGVKSSTAFDNLRARDAVHLQSVLAWRRGGNSLRVDDHPYRVRRVRVDPSGQRAHPPGRQAEGCRRRHQEHPAVLQGCPRVLRRVGPVRQPVLLQQQSPQDVLSERRVDEDVPEGRSGQPAGERP
jgi:hypothetical protein